MNRFRSPRIVSYTCEHCGATQTCPVGMAADGMCAACGSPMRIEDLFSDRRIISMPVPEDRRRVADDEAD